MTDPSTQPRREQRELTRQLRDEIVSQGPVVTTISDLLARLDEPDPTGEALFRAWRVLAEGGIRTKPALTGLFVKPGSKVRVMLGPVRQEPQPPPPTDRPDASPFANAVQAWRNANYGSGADLLYKLLAFFGVLVRETWRRAWDKWRNETRGKSS